MDMIKRSPYHHKFVELGATFVDRLGFAAPLTFTSAAQEHRATREAVGVFDVYYQIAIEIAGKDAETFLQSSSPGEFHPEALTEPYVKLSPHTAPTVQPQV